MKCPICVKKMKKAIDENHYTDEINNKEGIDKRKGFHCPECCIQILVVHYEPWVKQ